MEWTADTSAGEWLRERLDEPAEGWARTMHGVVPRGFPAYARVFHPTTRDRPVGEPWPARGYVANERAWAEFQDRAPEIDVERVGWAEVATAFGRVLHPLAQWERIAHDPDLVPAEDGPRDAAGWRYDQPAVGVLAADVVARVAAIAAGHTSTPDDGFAAVWAGHGGLLGFTGYGPSRVLLTASGEPRHDVVLGRSVRDSFNSVFRKPSWQPGILSDEISRGPQLVLPHREHVLFRAAPTEFADAAWAEHVPWTDTDVPGWTASPSLLWPLDRAWVLTTEVDWDSSIVAGPPELIAALCADDVIEALPLEPESSLLSDSDHVNR